MNRVFHTVGFRVTDDVLPMGNISFPRQSRTEVKRPFDALR